MSSVSSSSIANNTYTSTTSSNQVKISSELSKYLSSTESDSEDLIKIISKMYKEARSKTSTTLGVSISSVASTTNTSSDSSSSTDTKVTSSFTKSVKKFIQAYNAIVNDNNSYNDSGLKNLKKSMEKSINAQSSSLSDLGITIDGKGELKLDEDKCNQAVSKGNFNEFINNNKDRNGFFYEIKKIATNLKNDSTYYLSDKSKEIVKNASSTISNTSSTNFSNLIDTYA